MDKNGDLKWKTDNAIDEAYRRGFKDGATATWDDAYQTGYDDAKFQKEYAAYEERQTRYDIEKVYDPIEGAERYTFVPKDEQQTERACSNCFYERREADEDPCKDCGTLLEGHTNWRPKVKKEETK